MMAELDSGGVENEIIDLLLEMTDDEESNDGLELVNGGVILGEDESMDDSETMASSRDNIFEINDEEGSTDGSEPTEGCTAITLKKEKKKRKSRSKYGAPKVWKDDIRWTYTKMFVNVLNAMDPHLLFSFFKTFISRDFRYVTSQTIAGRPGYHFASSDIAMYTIRWYVRCLVAPDMAVRVESPVIRNMPDGSSIIIAQMSAKSTPVFKYPMMPEPGQIRNGDPAIIPFEPPKIVDGKKGNAFDSKIHLMSEEGVRLNKKYSSEKRIRVNRYASDEECSFLDELEVLVPSVPVSEPQQTRVMGSLVMRLDENKKLTSLEYLLNM